MSDEHYQTMYRYRGIEVPCKTCHGWGVRTYSGTSTWRGGIGGNMCTKDVCDACWGSGDAHEPWLNLRQARQEQRAWESARAIEWMAREFAVNSGLYRQGLLDLADLAEQQSRKRKLPPGRDAFWHARIWEGLASMLRRLVANAETKDGDK